MSHSNTPKCIFSWAPKFDPRIAQAQYIIVLLVLLIVLPFAVITVLYSRIIWVLRKERVANGSFAYHVRSPHRENTKVMKNICAIMVAFAVCVLPIHIFGIVYFFVWKSKMPCNMEQFGFAAHFAFFSNAAITPLIYFVFNDRYCKGLKDILRRMHFWRKGINKEIELNNLQACTL